MIGFLIWLSGEGGGWVWALFSRRCFKIHPSFFNMKLGASHCYSEWNAAFSPFESFLRKKVKKHPICETGVGTCGPCCIPAWHGEGAASSCCVNRWERKGFLSCHLCPQRWWLFFPEGTFTPVFVFICCQLYLNSALFFHPVCPVTDSLVCSGGLVKGQATSEMLLPFPAWLRWGGTGAGQLTVCFIQMFSWYLPILAWHLEFSELFFFLFVCIPVLREKLILVPEI